MDELKLVKDKERGARAEMLLRDELLKEAFDTLEKAYISEWAVTQVRDVEARERLWSAVNVNRKYQDHLRNVLANGKLAQKQLNDMTGLNKLAG